MEHSVEPPAVLRLLLCVLVELCALRDSPAPALTASPPFTSPSTSPPLNVSSVGGVSLATTTATVGPTVCAGYAMVAPLREVISGYRSACDPHARLAATAHSLSDHLARALSDDARYALEPREASGGILSVRVPVEHDPIRANCGAPPDTTGVTYETLAIDVAVRPSDDVRERDAERIRAPLAILRALLVESSQAFTVRPALQQPFQRFNGPGYHSELRTPYAHAHSSYLLYT